MFSGCTVPPDSKDTELGSSYQEASPLAGKNTGVVLVPCGAWKCVSTPNSSDADISEIPGSHLLWQVISLWGSQKLIQGFVSHKLTPYLSVFNLFLTQWTKTILSKGCTPDNFESHNSLKISFKNVRGFHLNFVECEPFRVSSSHDILDLCETILDDSIDSGNFYMTGYLPIIQKDSTTHICMVLQFKQKKDFLLHRAYL